MPASVCCECESGSYVEQICTNSKRMATKTKQTRCIGTDIKNPQVFVIAVLFVGMCYVSKYIENEEEKRQPQRPLTYHGIDTNRDNNWEDRFGKTNEHIMKMCHSLC